MFTNNIIYEDNVFVSITTMDDPFEAIGFFKEDLAEGLSVFEIQLGYMEIINVEEILKEAEIDSKAIFYGLDDIVAGGFIWRIFAVIKDLTLSFAQFYKLPSHKLHGVITRVEI